MDFIVTYGKMIFDVGLIALFLYILFANLPMQRLSGALKGIAVIAVLWGIARLINLPMAETTMGYLVQFSFLGLMIMFPKEFRQLLENIGRRRAFSGNTQNLIGKESREQLAHAVMNMARKRHGGIIVIAKESGLEDEILSGEYIGEMEIRQSFIEMLAHPDSMTSKGAVIIKDNQIVSAKAQLPIIANKELESVGAGKRHLAGLGIVADKDCMAIVVSGETGAITLVGKLQGAVSIDYALSIKERDVLDGIDTDFLISRMEDYLKGKSTVKKSLKASTKPPSKQKAKKG